MSATSRRPRSGPQLFHSPTNQLPLHGSSDSESEHQSLPKKQVVDDCQHDANEDLQRIENIIEFLKSGEGLDVWQWTAFKFGTEWKNNKKKSDRCRLLLLLQYPLFAVMCQGLAIVNLYVYLMYMEGDMSWMEDNLNSAMVFFFDVVILFVSLNILVSTANDGFYGALHHVPIVSGGCCCKLHGVPVVRLALRVFVDCKFMYTPLLVMGYFVNASVWAGCLLLNFLLIFHAENPLELVLNLVAVFFIMEIDDILVPPNAHKEMLKWFEDAANVPKMKSTHMSLSKYRFYVGFNSLLSVVLFSPFVFDLYFIIDWSADDAHQSLEVATSIFIGAVVIINMICKLWFYLDDSSLR